MPMRWDWREPIRGVGNTAALVAATSAAAGAGGLFCAWAIATQGTDGALESWLSPSMVLLPGVGIAAAIVYVRGWSRALVPPEESVRPSPTAAAPGGLPVVPDALVVVDPEERVVELNPAAELMFGCASGEAAGQPAARLIRDPVEGSAGEPKRSGRGEILGTSWRSVGHHRDGTVFDVEVAAVPRVRGQTRVLVVRDVLSSRVDQACSAEVIGTISREMRLPANMVQASAQIALHNVRHGKDIVADLDRIFRGCRRLRRLADDLLDLSRIESGPSSTEYVDVVALCGELLEELQPEGMSPRIELYVRNAVDPVRTDPERLGRLLLRLIQGATGKGAEASLRLVVWSTDDQLDIEARRGSGERSPEIEELDDRIVEALASALGVEVHPPTDSFHWRLSLPVDQTPPPRDDATVRLSDIGAPRGPASYRITDPGADPDDAVNAGWPEPQPRPTRRSRRRGSRPNSYLSDTLAVPRIAVFDTHDRTRRLLEGALGERGFRAVDLGADPVESVRLARPHAIVAQVGRDWQPLAMLAQTDVGAAFSVLGLDETGDTGCRFRVDSVHARTDAPRRIREIARRVQPPGTAVVLLPRGEERQALTLTLKNEGWSVVATARVETIEHRIEAQAMQLLVADPAVPGVPRLLATLHRSPRGVEHVALHLPPPASSRDGETWVRGIPERRPFSEIVADLALELASNSARVGDRT